jgi:hypothetical protein
LVYGLNKTGSNIERLLMMGTTVPETCSGVGTRLEATSNRTSHGGQRLRVQWRKGSWWWAQQCPKHVQVFNKTRSNIEPDITRWTEATCAVKERLLMMGTTVPKTWTVIPIIRSLNHHQEPFRLLMMGTTVPETCWALHMWINKNLLKIFKVIVRLVGFLSHFNYICLSEVKASLRFKTLMTSGSKKGTHIYFCFLSNVPANEPPPGLPNRVPMKREALYRAFCISLKNIIFWVPQ